ncbi:MAG: CdaR family protein [Kiritimatiellia bacterium]
MKKFFESDLFLRIASLFMAVLIWFAIRQVTSYEETLYDIDLDIRQGEGWAVEDVSSDAFQITFQGSREDISRLKRESIRVEIDLRGRENDQQVLKLGPKNIIFPGVARVSSIRPDSVRVRMDQEVEKSVPVKAVFAGTLSPGYAKDAETVQPPAVTLRGSRKQLDLITSLQTSPIDLSGRPNSFETRVTVLPPAGSWVKRIEPNRVLVLVSISHRVVEKTFDRVPVLVPPGNGVAEPAFVSVRAEADEDKAALLKPGAVEVLLDIVPDLPADPAALHPLRGRAPEGVRILEVTPSKAGLRGLPPPAKDGKEPSS